MTAKYKLPDGVQDYIGDEEYTKNKLENLVLALFASHGYHKIETPAIEYYNMFSTGFGAVDENKLFKLTDTDGSILALRPDMTLPISRVVSTKLSGDVPLRLYYNAPSFALQGSYHKLRQYDQLGVELIGSDATMADVEVISLAIKALLKMGLEDFKIDLGQIEYFKGILAQLNLDEESLDEIISLVNKKDMLAIELFVTSRGLDKSVARVLRKLPLLCGGSEIITEARELAPNPRSISALDNLYEIYSLLEKQGFGKYLTIDLGNAASMNYYSGIVFKGITRASGAPVLSGGRYDDLCKPFNRALPSTGFAIGTKNVLKALEKQNKLYSIPSVDYAIGYELGQEITALNYIEQKIAEGKTTLNTFMTDKASLLQFAKGKKAAHSVYITASGEEVIDG